MIIATSNWANIAINTAILAISVYILWKGAGILVESASRIAVRFGVSELVIGLTVVAIGTSAPEFAVTVNAAVRGQADISVGNIVGSNIFNLGFILGVVAMVRPIQTERKIVHRDGVFLLAITLLLLIFLIDRRIERVEGGVMLATLIAYMGLLFFKKEKVEDDVDAHHTPATWKDFILLPLGIGLVIAGGHFLVESSVLVARSIGVSEWVIGVTVVAAGTSAPEMATSLAAILKGREGISAGNLIGSNIFNTLGVLGLAGLLRPMVIAPSSIYTMALLIVMTAAAVIFMRTGWAVSRKEGLLLFLTGIIIWVIDFLV